MRKKPYFTSFRASWKAAAPAWGQWKRGGKKSPAKRSDHDQYDSVSLFLVQEKTGSGIHLGGKTNKQTEPATTLGCAPLLTLPINSPSPAAHLKPHNLSLLEAALNSEVPDSSSRRCFTGSCCAAVADRRQLARWISEQGLRGELGSQRQGK